MCVGGGGEDVCVGGGGGPARWARGIWFLLS